MSHYLVSDIDFIQPEIIEARNAKTAVAEYCTDNDGTQVEGAYKVWTLRSPEPRELKVWVENRVIIEKVWVENRVIIE